jgi:hypothetical protein
MFVEAIARGRGRGAELAPPPYIANHLPFDGCFSSLFDNRGAPVSSVQAPIEGLQREVADRAGIEVEIEVRCW